MWLTSDTKTECQNYIEKVDGIKGYTGDITSTWAKPTKHPNKSKYRVIKHEGIEPDEAMTEKTESELKREGWFDYPEI